MAQHNLSTSLFTLAALLVVSTGSSGCLFGGYDGVFIESEDVSLDVPEFAEAFRAEGDVRGDAWWLIDQTATNVNGWVGQRQRIDQRPEQEPGTHCKLDLSVAGKVSDSSHGAPLRSVAYRDSGRQEYSKVQLEPCPGSGSNPSSNPVISEPLSVAALIAQPLTAK